MPHKYTVVVQNYTAFCHVSVMKRLLLTFITETVFCEITTFVDLSRIANPSKHFKSQINYTNLNLCAVS